MCSTFNFYFISSYIHDVDIGHSVCTCLTKKRICGAFNGFTGMGSFSMKVILLSSSFFLSSAAPPHFAFCSFGARHTWSGVILRTLRSPRFFSPFFQMLSTDFNRFCFTIFTKLHNPICHFALVGLLHHGHLSFSKNSDLGSKKFRWFYQAVEAPVILFNDVSEMVFKASWRKEGRNGHKRLAFFLIRNYKLNCQPFVVTLRYLKALDKISSSFPRDLQPYVVLM